MKATARGSIIAFMDDLMFLSRIREAAEPGGLRVQAVRTPATLVETCRIGRPSIVFMDLDSRRLASFEAIAALRSDPEVSTIPVVGFLGHTETERAQQARQAGCTRVLTRGAFVTELHLLIQSAPPRAAEADSDRIPG